MVDQKQAIWRDLLAGLLAEPGESMGKLGATLAAIISPTRAAFSRQYVFRLKTGQDVITEEIGRSIEALAAMHDNVGELQARAREYRVMATHPLSSGCIVLGVERACALPGCRIRFVPASPRQRYCSKQCRKDDARRRRDSRP